MRQGSRRTRGEILTEESIPFGAAICSNFPVRRLPKKRISQTYEVRSKKGILCKQDQMRKISIIIFFAMCLVSRAASSGLPFIEDDYGKALAESKQRKLPIFVECWAPW